ncbi:MAG: prepilin-type N-terminal cleavage/methylation domain-containing protein [Methylophaga sp.]|nr:prepilin-type N-terminal cleavage/methylation domain-containing protein [Methylophaga sp.]
MRCLLFFPVKSYLKRHAQSGFTLIELLVVVLILAAIAGTIVVSYDDVGTQAQYDTTKFEMAEIRKALLQFRRDSGSRSFPNQGDYDCTVISSDNFPSEAGTTNSEKVAWCQSPANFWMLFEDPLDDNNWDPDTHRGWNGPYLQRNNGYLDIDADYDIDGTMATESDSIIDNVWGIASSYLSEPLLSGDLTWRPSISDDDHAKYGTPYFMFDLADKNKARLVSMSLNNKYEGTNTTAPCSPKTDSDDLILCLLR